VQGRKVTTQPAPRNLLVEHPANSTAATSPLTVYRQALADRGHDEAAAANSLPCCISFWHFESDQDLGYEAKDQIQDA
jgi:hypothetical protein